MTEENFRTVVPVPSPNRQIGYADGLLLMGSCFTENIGQRLLDYKFQAILNPFGIVFNPQSLSDQLSKLMSGEPYTAEDLNLQEDKWLSFAHHGRFSHRVQETVLARINGELNAGKAQLQKAQFLFLTFGSAFAYRHKKTEKIVANCHKVPNKEFDKVFLDFDALKANWRKLIQDLKLFNPELKLVFTVSPVRHWKDGAVENQRSKSLLHLLCDAIQREFDHCDYFPAYEIVMDDLRDYRFYKTDLLHPSPQAIDYIWSGFKTAWVHVDNESVFKDLDKIRFAMDHRTDDPESRTYQRFVQKHLDLIESMVEKYPFLQLETEMEHFRILKI